MSIPDLDRQDLRCGSCSQGQNLEKEIDTPMKKSDLRSGMFVTLRNGECYYVILNATHPVSGADILVRRDHGDLFWMPLSHYDNDLCYHDDPDDMLVEILGPSSAEEQAEWDIVSVEAPKDITVMFSPKDSTYKTIYERSTSHA